jgi:hypothetical protein
MSSIETTTTTPSTPEAPEPKKKSWFARHKVLTGIAGVAVLAVVGTAMSGGSDDSTVAATDTDSEAAVEAEAETPAEGTQEEPAAEAEAPAAEEAPAEAIATIGTPVRDGQFEFVVLGVETGVASVGGEFGETAQGEYTLVEMTVTNIGDEPQMFTDSDQTGFDSQGRELNADTSAGIWANEDARGFLEDINPGNSVTVKVVYDLPAGEQLTSVMLHDSMFSGGVEVSLV